MHAYSSCTSMCACDMGYKCTINVGCFKISPSLLRTVPRVPGNISILGIKLSDQIRKMYCLTVMIPDFVWFLQFNFVRNRNAHHVAYYQPRRGWMGSGQARSLQQQDYVDYIQTGLKSTVHRYDIRYVRIRHTTIIRVNHGSLLHPMDVSYYHIFNYESVLQKS